MSRQIVFLIKDDLDPELAADRTHVLTLDGRTVQLDLCEKNSGILEKVLHPYFEAGLPITLDEPQPAAEPLPGQPGSKMSMRAYRTAAREWARTRPEWRDKVTKKTGGSYYIPKDLLRAFDATITTQPG